MTDPPPSARPAAIILAYFPKKVTGDEIQPAPGVFLDAFMDVPPSPRNG
jgi:hypothetical protein